MKPRTITSPPLHLRAGDLVEVRSEREILATLDGDGTVDGMPFMPEMLAFCGKRFPVYKRADKTCDTIDQSGSRRLYDTVHLEGTRCTGRAHGDCQALCLLFWKEAWLKRVQAPTENISGALRASQTAENDPSLQSDRRRLYDLTRRQSNTPDEEIHYRCQATDLLKASFPLPWWDVGQYLREARCGNAKLSDLLRALLFFCFRKMVDAGVGYRALIWTYNKLQKWRGGTPYPFRHGTQKNPPRTRLGLIPGDLVRVRPIDEIMQTLTPRNRNYGLYFGPEMVPYCGKVHRVLSHVERIIDERTGKMMPMKNDCLILDGAICRSHYSDRRLFCPRSIYPFWREIWLTRAEEEGS